MQNGVITCVRMSLPNFYQHAICNYPYKLIITFDACKILNHSVAFNIAQEGWRIILGTAVPINGFAIGACRFFSYLVEAERRIYTSLHQALVPLTVFRSNSKFVLNRSQRNFASVTTVTLSWRVQNVFVIGLWYFQSEHSKCWSNFELDRNIVSGTGARSSLVQIMACRLIGAKPLSKLMLTYCELKN